MVDRELGPAPFGAQAGGARQLAEDGNGAAGDFQIR
jgi:hypothetical protein